VLEVVVEGVETEEQLELIRTNDCAELIQGFIFGAPMSVGSIVELVSNLQSKTDRKAGTGKELAQS
jgi:EAL domain-containing protein (putative c-di-GMP-specific phosphodiesterase class I)